MTDSEHPPDDAGSLNAEVADAAAVQREAAPPATWSDDAVEPIFLTEDRSRQRAPLGPGLLEAQLWILAFFMLELGGSLVWMFGVTAWHVIKTGAAPAQAELEGLLQPVMSWMVGSIKFVEVVAAILAIRLRYGTQAFRLTGFRPIPGLHTLVLALAILPTAFLSGQCFALLQGYWDLVTDRIPGLKFFDGLSSIEAVQEMATATPLVILVLIIAVFPALNEEFVFRAGIGRGLVARYRLIAGIALTSLLFAAVHLSPVHAAALLPLAVLMHVGYLSSGSIWWPVTVHFLNNALSVVLMKLATVAPDVGGVKADVTEAQFSPIMFIAAVACVASTIWLLMTIRIRWKKPDGTLWRPEIESVEPPPPEIDATAVVPLPPTAPLIAAIISYAAFPVAFGIALAMGQLS